MKRLIKSAAGVICASALLVGCNSGTTTSSGSYTPTQYEFTGLVYNINFGSSGCSSGSGSIISLICPTSFSGLSIDNIGYSSNPASYLVIPASSALPAGVSLNSSGTCQTTPVSTYGSCSISVSASNVASGSTVSIPINGSLGQLSFITITFN